MTKGKIEHTKKSESLWLMLFTVGLLLFLIPSSLWVIFTQKEWIGFIVVAPMLILLYLMIRGLWKLKIIQISDDRIAILNYWNRKIEQELHPHQFSKLIYYVPLKSTPPYSAIKITAYENNLNYQFSVKGFYPEDLVKDFNRYGFPIYQKMMDKTIRRMN